MVRGVFDELEEKVEIDKQQRNFLVGDFKMTWWLSTGFSVVGRVVGDCDGCLWCAYACDV